MPPPFRPAARRRVAATTQGGVHVLPKLQVSVRTIDFIAATRPPWRPRLFFVFVNIFLTLKSKCSRSLSVDNVFHMSVWSSSQVTISHIYTPLRSRHVRAWFGEFIKPPPRL